ncbi:MAG: DOMON-like domain-containing protein [Cyanobacteriota bacterium]
MTMAPLVLQPFHRTGFTDSFSLEATVERRGDLLAIDYRLQGPIGQLVLPEPAAAAARRDELWRSTCFEAFLGVPGAEGYWEVNLSPAGHWNGYRLRGYRLDLQPEPGFTSLPCVVACGSDQLELGFAIDLAALVPAGQPIELALATVLEARRQLGSADGPSDGPSDGTEAGDGPEDSGDHHSFWALAHAGREADFHRRESFVVSI